MYLVNYNPNSYQVLGYLDPMLGFHPTDDGTAYFSIDDDIHAQYSNAPAWTDGKIITNVAPENEFMELTENGWVLDAERQAAALEEAKLEARSRINDAVAAIYDTFNPYVHEYALREKQAQAFIQAGYEGDVPPQIAAVAEPVGMTPKEAADSVIEDAQKLQTALEQLGVLRMQKLAIGALETLEDVEALVQRVLLEISEATAEVNLP